VREATKHCFMGGLNLCLWIQVLQADDRWHWFLNITCMTSHHFCLPLKHDGLHLQTSRNIVSYFLRWHDQSKLIHCMSLIYDCNEIMRREKIMRQGTRATIKLSLIP
jgi:hypothetical protein